MTLSLLVIALNTALHILGWIPRHTIEHGLPYARRLRKWLSTPSTRMDADANLIATPAASRQRKLTTFPV